MLDPEVKTVTIKNLDKPSFFAGFRLRLIGAAVLFLLAAWGVWSWGFCRFYVRPGQMAIITAKAGDPLEPGQILA
ncbi:MAG: hypothetical protein LBU64_01485, partial [Planctomycetota bacterium]|nr:hypothetical protein [Planctomycetota bacterium]